MSYIFLELNYSYHLCISFKIKHLCWLFINDSDQIIGKFKTVNNCLTEKSVLSLKILETNL